MDGQDLLERLRAVESSRGDSDYASNWHRNPDGPEAADEIERLRDFRNCWRNLRSVLDSQIKHLEGEVARLLSLTRFQDRVIRSGDTACLTQAEREAICWVCGDVADITGPVEDTLRGLLERFPSALSPMSLPPHPEDGEEEDERIWRSDRNTPDE